MRYSIRVAATAAVMVLGLLGRAVAGPLEDGEAAFNRQDYAAALELLKPLADHGSAAAQYWVGMMYSSGSGVTEDDVAGAAWNRKAAAQGFAPAKAMVLGQCMSVQPTAQDGCDLIFAGIRASAEQGDPAAQMQLGSQYLLGKGAPKDPVQGLAWIRKAADQGFVRAQFAMGMMLSSSLLGAPADHAQSLSWYRKAADQGDPPALNALGMVYEMGADGVDKDPGLAASWYRKAAEKGDLTGEMSLAKMYDQGEGVAKDDVQALYWHRKLAEQGSAEDQAKVGTAYALGKGVGQDYLQAYVWLDLAVAEAGGGSADTVLARDSMISHLSPAQLAEAKRQSAALKAKIDAQ